MKIKILHLTTDSKIAGTEKLLLEIAEKYDRNIFDLQFCTLLPRGKFHEEIEKLGCNAYALNFVGLRNIVTVYAKLRNLLVKENFHIIHTHLFLSSFLGLLAASSARVPAKIMTRHYSDYMYLFGNFLKIKIDRWSLGKADRIIAVSAAVAKVIIERDKIRSDKVIIIHNGIDLDKINSGQYDSQEAKKELGFNEVNIVGAVGSLELRKGHHFLIQAAQKIIHKVPSIKFVIVGEGPLLEELMGQAKNLGLDGHVLFTGYRSDVLKCICAFDVFVHPSAEEGFGIAVLEALAIGKPVVAFAVGGIPEIIANVACAKLIAPGDIEGMAEAVINFIANKDKEGIKNEGRKIVRDNFAAKDMVNKYERLYKELAVEKIKDVAQIA